MTDSEILFVSRADIVNNSIDLAGLYAYKSSSSDKQIDALSANECIAVIGGIICEGQRFRSLRLFKCKDLAGKYIVELLSQVDVYGFYDYAEVQIQEITVSTE